MGEPGGDRKTLTRREFLKLSTTVGAVALLKGSFPGAWALAKGGAAELELTKGDMSKVDRSTANALLLAHWEIARQIREKENHYRVEGGPYGNLPNHAYDWNGKAEYSPIMPWGQATTFNGREENLLTGPMWATVEMNPTAFVNGEIKQGIMFYSPINVLGPKLSFVSPSDIPPGDVLEAKTVDWLDKSPFDIVTRCTSGQFAQFWLSDRHLREGVVSADGQQRVVYLRPRDEFSKVHVYIPLYPTGKGLKLAERAAWLGQDEKKPSAYQYAGVLDLGKATLSLGGTLKYVSPDSQEDFGKDMWGISDPLLAMVGDGQFVDLRVMGTISNLIRKLILGGDLGIKPTIEEMISLWKSTGSRFLGAGATFSQEMGGLTDGLNYDVINGVLRRIYNGDTASLATVPKDQLRQELVLGFN